MQSPNAVKGLQLQQMQIEKGRVQKNPFQVNRLWSRLTRGCGYNHQSSNWSFFLEWLKKEKEKKMISKHAQQGCES